MDEEQTRDFWERALRDIPDGGFFAPVQTAEPLVASPIKQQIERPKRRHPTSLELGLIVLFASLLLVLAVVSWLAPALF